MSAEVALALQDSMMTDAGQLVTTASALVGILFQLPDWYTFNGEVTSRLRLAAKREHYVLPFSAVGADSLSAK